MIRRVLCGMVAAAGLAGAAPLFEFPTPNQALAGGNPAEFYMYVDRDFEGEKSQPWEGGSFGFVRGPQRWAGGVLFATLHEGIDIKPVTRDAQGNPLDPIFAAAAGRVVHVSDEAGASNYGRYIVLEHLIGRSPFYTLYAHLASSAVKPGDMVRQGDVIGKMGYTGRGLDRVRAHLHFEIAVMANRNFEGWYEALQSGSANRHGLFNGMNLIGTDPAPVLLGARENPNFNLAAHIRGLEPAFSLTVPNVPGLSLIRDYPWLVPDGENAAPPAWTISFTRSGFPVRAMASETPVSEARVAWVAATKYALTHATRGIVGGTANAPRLTDSGRRFARLLTWPD